MSLPTTSWVLWQKEQRRVSSLPDRFTGRLPECSADSAVCPPVRTCPHYPLNRHGGQSEVVLKVREFSRCLARRDISLRRFDRRSLSRFDHRRGLNGAFKEVA